MNCQIEFKNVKRTLREQFGNLVKVEFIIAVLLLIVKYSNSLFRFLQQKFLQENNISFLFHQYNLKFMINKKFIRDIDISIYLFHCSACSLTMRNAFNVLGYPMNGTQLEMTLIKNSLSFPKPKFACV